MTGPDDAYVGGIKVLDLRTDETRAYTHGTARDMQPRFSPDGSRLLFISDRTGQRQIWLIDLAGGEPYPAPTLPGNISYADFSPDGRRIAAIATPDTHAREIAQRGWRRIDRMRYRADGIGYLDDFPQLWLIDLATGAKEALSDGTGQVASPAWSPDGASIAYAGEHAADSDTLWHRELWVVDVAAHQPRKILTLGGAIEAPAWSEDGTQLAFLGFDEPHHYAVALLRLFTIRPDGSDVRCRTAGSRWICGNQTLNDLEAGAPAVAPAWTAGGDILVLATENGSTGVRRVTAEGAGTEITGWSCAVSAFAQAGDDRLIICASDCASPPELYAIGRQRRRRRLTTETAQWCAARTLRSAERLDVTARSGPIDAWVMRGDARTPRPAVLQIHGGPHAAYGDTFFFEFQLLAAAGMDVIFCNPRGSLGYGDAFATAIIGDWAAPAFDDCMDALDAAIERGGIDGARLGVAGGSYGGYLTAWCIGHSDRFDAAIAMRPATDLASLWGTSEVGRMLDYELGAGPDDDPARYRAQSPLTYADDIRTPLLLIHSDLDYRCPIGQSEQMLSALKRRGAEVELLRFTGADHGLSRSGPPRMRVARLRAIVNWFSARLGTDVDDV